MRIGIVLSNPPAYSETFFRSKIRGLIEHGIHVQLYCQNTDESFDLCPVIKSPKTSTNPFIQGFYFIKVYLQLLLSLKGVLNYIILELKEGSSILQIFKKVYLNAHLLSAKLDWIHFGFATQALGSETVAKAIEARMAISFRGFDIAIYPLKHPGCYTTLWKFVDKVHVISNDLLVKAKEQGLPEQVSVEKITPAIDVEVFSRQEQNLREDTSKFQLLTVGRLHWKKGLVVTLEALQIVKKNEIDFMYTIVGEGNEYERIAFAAHQLGLNDYVCFVGKKERPEVVELYSQTDLYLQYSIQEGFCNAVLEAQSMELLCIVSDAEGLPENIIDQETGWVVPKHNAIALANKIIEVLSLSKEKKKEISNNAQQRVRKKFNIAQQQKSFVKFYSEE